MLYNSALCSSIFSYSFPPHTPPPRIFHTNGLNNSIFRQGNFLINSCRVMSKAVLLTFLSPHLLLPHCILECTICQCILKEEGEDMVMPMVLRLSWRMVVSCRRVVAQDFGRHALYRTLESGNRQQRKLACLLTLIHAACDLWGKTWIDFLRSRGLRVRVETTQIVALDYPIVLIVRVTCKHWV